MPDENELPAFEKQKEVITDILNDMAVNKLISEQAIFSVALNIVCNALAQMPRKDYKFQYKRIDLAAKVMRAKSMNEDK